MPAFIEHSTAPQVKKEKANEMDTSPETQRGERQGTPERPPYSPVTPVLKQLAMVPGGATIVPPATEPSPSTTTAVAATYTTSSGETPQSAPANASRQQQQSQSQLPPPQPPPPPPPTIAPEPAPVPISESDNPDVIALRSAISILQMQKQRALSDIKTLNRLKQVAAADPEKFAQELMANRSTGRDDSANQFVDLRPPETGESDDEAGSGERNNASLVDQLPRPQNVIRMPPINWAKYHIIGEPLDRMHEEQRQRPVSGEPRQSDPAQRAPEHVLAAPYQPLTDRLETPSKSRGKKDKKT